MDADPFDPWYASRIDIDEERHFKPGEWDFFTINHDENSTRDVLIVDLKPEQVNSWVSQQSKSPSKLPGIDLLVGCHKRLGKEDVSYRWLPFQAAQFRHIFTQLHLPTQYFHLRGTGGTQSGASMYRTYRDDRGRITRISLIIRPAHTSVARHSSAWSFVLSWDATTGRTTGYLDGMRKCDRNDLIFYVKLFTNLLAHPLTLPEIALHMILTHLNENVRVPSEHEYYLEERRIGLSRVHHLQPEQEYDIWKWKFKDFQESTLKANRFITTVAYTKRRLAFASQITRRLLTMIEELGAYDFDNTAIRDRVLYGQRQRRERLLNKLDLLENYSHQSECVQRRAENLISVLYTVSSQVDSQSQAKVAKANLDIAQAVRSDSIPVRTIAYVTLVLLPPALIATIFGMNFFAFDPETSSLIVAKTFWQYWAVTIPVTALTIIIWNIWVWLERVNGGKLGIHERLLKSRVRKPSAWPEPPSGIEIMEI